MGVTKLFIFQEGQSYPPPPQILRIIQYKTLRSVIFVINIIPYFLYWVILHYKWIKEKQVAQWATIAHLRASIMLETP